MNAAQQLLAEYDAMAAHYARHWAPVLRPMGRRLLDELPLATARRIFDVGTGTGALLPDLAAAAPSARIVGADGSGEMLRLARNETSHPVALMELQHLAARSQAFDVALLAFVLFHSPDPPATLCEVHRVLRDGGALGLATWSKDQEVPGVSIWREELDAAGAPPDPRPQSVMQSGIMDTPEKVTALLEAAGFGAVRAWSRSFEHRWTVHTLSALHGGCGMPGRRAKSLPEAERAACRARAEARLAQLTPEQLVYRPEVVFAVARRQ